MDSKPNLAMKPTPAEKPSSSNVVKITPATPAIRVPYDPSTSRKKRKAGDAPEATLAYFGGKLPEQPKTTALSVFSFLSNSDLINGAGLVCKRWNRLSKDEELWKFQS
jgi:hypothetical protein